MMGYRAWFDHHARAHRALVERLQHLSPLERLSYFRFESMCEHEPNFCSLYARGESCHLQSINCYWCACPFFRFHDEGVVRADGMRLYSRCARGLGCEYHHEGSVHHDCSGCLVAHDEGQIRHFLDQSWEETMRKCPLEDPKLLL